jgi:hypothetical protein
MALIPAVGARRRALAAVKIAVFAPIPMDRERMAVAGEQRRTRQQAAGVANRVHEAFHRGPPTKAFV